MSCPQCGTGYLIGFPPSGAIMKVLDGADLLVGRLCPVVAGGVIVGGVYWSCVTFGAVTIMQVDTSSLYFQLLFFSLESLADLAYLFDL